MGYLCALAQFNPFSFRNPPKLKGTESHTSSPPPPLKKKRRKYESLLIFSSSSNPGHYYFALEITICFPTKTRGIIFPHVVKHIARLSPKLNPNFGNEAELRRSKQIFHRKEPSGASVKMAIGNALFEVDAHQTKDNKTKPGIFIVLSR